MSEQNKQIARRFSEVFESGDTSVLEAIVSENVIDHNPLPGQPSGRRGIIDAVMLFRRAFPDMKVVVERQVAEGEYAAVYGVVTGTHQGDMLGIPATGKPVRFPYMDLHRIVDGQIVESWHLEDIAGVLAQLGVMPA